MGVLLSVVSVRILFFGVKEVLVGFIFFRESRMPLFDRVPLIGSVKYVARATWLEMSFAGHVFSEQCSKSQGGAVSFSSVFFSFSLNLLSVVLC